MQKSIWTKGIDEKELPSLNKDIKCDILIIGGGIAGLSAALNLKDKNVVLIDKGKVGYGVTSKTTGKLTYMQGIYSKIESIYNFNVAKKYLYSQIDAIKMAMDIIKEYHINCDLKKVDSYLFENEKSYLSKEKEFLKKAGIKYYNATSLPIKFPALKSIYVKDTAVFHPLKYLMGIKKIVLENNIQIYENTKAISLDKKEGYYIVKTDNNIIKAKKVIVCTHYPFFVIPGFIPFKIHQDRSYVAISKANNQYFSAINTNKPLYSLRYYKDFMLLGGFSHALSDKLDYEKEENKLLDFHQKHFKNKILYSWMVHDNITNDYIPLIGRLNKNNPNLLIATGFNKWGMTNGILAGKILKDIITGKKNEYQKLFDPSRKLTFKKIENIIVNNFKISKTYITTKILKPKMKEAYITNIDGKKCGVYIDSDGKKHIVNLICPHLKCNLVFNNKDKTWDCPCHGSRFSIDGDLIEGPSVFPIKIKDNIKKM